MITIFHGTNTPLSRKQFIDIKQASPNPILFNGATVTLSDLIQALEGQSLFADNTQVFIEDFFSKRKAGKETESLTTYVTVQGQQNTIVLWESKELTTKQLNALGKPTVKKFDVPKEVFAFLDSLLPNNSKQMVDLFHRILITEEPEFVFFMIVRQFRMMLGLISSEKGWHGGKAAVGVQSLTSTDGKEPVTEPFSGSEQIEELKRLTWQKNKLLKQAQSFGMEKLLTNYDKLFAIESGMKTGQLSTSLEQAIDFFLTTV